MSSKNNNASSSTESDMVFIVAIIAACTGIYYLADYIFLPVWKYVRIAQLYVLTFLDQILPFLHIDTVLNPRKVLNILLETNIDAIEDNIDIFRKIDAFYAMFFVPFFGLFLLFKLKKSIKKNKYLNSFMGIDGEKFIKLYSKEFPHLEEIVDKPQEDDFKFKRDGDNFFVQPLGYKEFCTMKPPLGLSINEGGKNSIWDEKKNSFSGYLADKALSAQLGEIYNGYDEMGAHHKRMFDFFVSKINIEIIDTKEVFIGDESVFDILSEVKSDDNKYFLAEKIMRLHGYTRTGLVSLYVFSKNFCNSKPVVEFHWLKRDDRILWFAIQGASMSAYYTECLGVMSHYLFEKTIGQAIHTPCIDEGVESLKKSLTAKK